jgi:CheY-like chemotaxis protein
MDNERAHILIVDDSADDRLMYAHFLSHKGYRVSKARDGKEGLEKAFELQPDLILMDLWLPRISGWQATQRLKVDKRTKDIPVLIITGISSVWSRDCDGWLTKPCPLDQLDQEITRVLVARA